MMLVLLSSLVDRPKGAAINMLDMDSRDKVINHRQDFSRVSLAAYFRHPCRLLRVVFGVQILLLGWFFLSSQM